MLLWDGTNWVPDANVNVDITKNKSDIATNSTDISALQNSLSTFVINNCGDVDTTTTAPTTDDTLTWNGTNWIPDSSVNIDISTNASNIAINTTNIQSNADNFTNMVINDCNDVDTVSIAPIDLDVMLWDGSNSKWIPDSTVNANITANTTNISTNTANIAINTNH